MVKCLTHGLRGFNGAVQRRLATLTVTMLVSSCWQLSSEVELRRIFDVCKRWANSGSHEFVKKNMVRYTRPHLQCANRPFWPLVSKYTISTFQCTTFPEVTLTKYFDNYVFFVINWGKGFFLITPNIINHNKYYNKPYLYRRWYIVKRTRTSDGIIPAFLAARNLRSWDRFTFMYYLQHNNPETCHITLFRRLLNKVRIGSFLIVYVHWSSLNEKIQKCKKKKILS